MTIGWRAAGLYMPAGRRTMGTYSCAYGCACGTMGTYGPLQTAG